MPGIEVSMALPPSFEAPRLIATAEKLGYRRAYLYDTPFEGYDVWLALSRAAALTSTIGVGPCVLIPTQRHVIVNAAQTVELHHQAPGRVTVAFGTGFSSRAAVGQPPVRWAYMEAYMRCYQALLAGRTAEWDGKSIKLMLTSEQACVLPLNIPLLVAAMGPKGLAVARRLGADGLVSISRVVPGQNEFRRAVVATTGTVLDRGEDLTDERVRVAAGAPWAGTLHFIYTVQGADAVRKIPGGSAWLEVIEKVPADQRHLAVNQGHMVEMNEADVAAWRAGGYSSLPTLTLTGTAEDVKARVDSMIDAGANEIIIEPAGPDIERELTAFISAVGR